MTTKLCLVLVLCFPLVAQGGSIVADYTTIPDGTYPSITLAGTTVTGSSSVVSALYAGHRGLGILGGGSNVSLDVGETMSIDFGQLATDVTAKINDIDPPGNVTFGFTAFSGATNLGNFMFPAATVADEVYDVSALAGGQAMTRYTIFVQNPSAPLGLQIQGTSYNAVPEPATGLLCGSLFLILLGYAWQRQRVKSITTVVAVVTVLTGLSLQAAVIPVGIGAFPPGPPQIDFGPNPTGQPINGQTLGGVAFKFTINGLPSADAIIDSGPGNTNNIQVANIEGNAAGVLSLAFPQPEHQFGYGYSIAAIGGVVPNATTIQLYDALSNPIGGLSYTAAPDPGFSGGFAGIQSDIPFMRAEVTFLPGAGRFAFDNVRFNPVPEPSALILLGIGAIGLLAYAWRRRRSGVQP